jgi:hypothetical protein
VRQPTVICTPYPTPEEVAKNYGVSRKRLNELGALVDEFLSRSSASKTKKGKPTTAALQPGTSRKRSMSAG